MFGATKKSASIVSVAVLASALISPAAIAATPGHPNAMQTSQACYGMGQGDGNADQIPVVVPCSLMHSHAQYPAPAPVATTTSSTSAANENPMLKCVGGYTWRYNMAGNWMTLPLKCQH